MAKKDQSESRLEQIRQGRIEKAEKLRALGVDPYPTTFGDREFIAGVREKELDEPARIAGRIVLWRRHGGSTFAQLRDETGQIQIQLRKDVVGEEQYELVKLLDVGDFLGVAGKTFRTSTDEYTVGVEEFSILTKALRPLPEKFHGLKDPELIARKRHLAMIADSAQIDLIRKRSDFVRRMRAFLDNEGFVEVATPAIETIPGGADAEPFVTHHNALDADFYLRISLELAHKRLIVGGMERIYEVGRVFRNEGLSREHLQDYDLLEFYWAYADLHDLKQLTQDFYADIIQGTFGTLKLTYGDDELDFTPPWPEVDYFDLFRAIDVDLAEYPTADDLLPVAQKLNIEGVAKGLGRGRLIDMIYKQKIRPTLIQPQVLVGHPVDVSPLAKRNTEDPSRVQRLQVLMAGSEVGNGFAELNDPVDQRARFEEQQRLREAGDKEAQRLDEDFLEALEYGMPPTAGFGVSIERFFMYLTNSPSIRDVVAFPLTRPLE